MVGYITQGIANAAQLSIAHDFDDGGSIDFRDPPAIVFNKHGARNRISFYCESVSIEIGQIKIEYHHVHTESILTKFRI